MENRKPVSLPPPHIARSLLTLRADRDTMRPRYHFTPPGGWMNDPNAPLWHQGQYHLFYQHNPYNDTHGTMYWGHCRSSDLLSFEDLSIALEPKPELDESGCWSGSGMLSLSDCPVLLYTGAAGSPERHNAQNAAIGDQQLRRFPVRVQNILPLPPFPIRQDWRDPFMFRYEQRVLVVIAAVEDQQGVLLLYEATDRRLQHYRFLSRLFRFPPGSMQFPECPNFIQVGSKWVLLISPYRSVEYWIGEFDADAGRFLPEQHGILDHDNGQENGLYATNVFCCPENQHQPILVGWLRGYPEGQGWSGALALPRVLELGTEQRLLQRPWPLVEKLRRDEFRLKIDHKTRRLYAGLNFEMQLDLRCDPPDTQEGGTLHLCRLDLGCPPHPCYLIALNPDGIRLGREDTIPYQLSGPLKSARVFRDGMTLEIFLNNGQQVVSRSLHPMFSCGILRLYSDTCLDAVLWHLKL
ncbi:glycoside hydrolase family 32 protein [Spirochaeta africana]|uniref:beta-fructofuranosidase n=1 Tax=Spirochaeta africana (strain ATCC 700263 / DSM 8902 / Z-7692) TaxID=889378 RepID=H9UIL5_SPIAZ|nr:glycoside hydrolase family 32 protein [Spirochaeta africana]AFG37358.1 beta-fructosidase, levanase/invertase [Spirochaeta africana DSM 8902]